MGVQAIKTHATKFSMNLWVINIVMAVSVDISFSYSTVLIYWEAAGEFINVI